MPKSQSYKPNGFVLFAQELMNNHGRKYSSLKEAIDAASPLWNRLSKEQKQRYDSKAKEIKGQCSRYTSEGLDVEQLTKEEQLKSQLEENARQEIRNLITMTYQKGPEALASETFFLINSNIFCYYNASDTYYPAEIAVLGFSLKDGVKQENLFHYMVDPGKLPIGYKFEAKQHSDETHLIKVPFESDGEGNQEEVYFSLKAFLEKKKKHGSKKMPMLFADKKCVKMIQRILNQWCEAFDDGHTERFRVYNLQVMFFILRNTVAGQSVWSSITFSDRELEKDVYAYVPEVACEFHAATAKPLYCSQSIVSRYAYVMCDNCCPDLNIDLEPGQHVPIHSTIPDTTSTYGSSTTRSMSRSSVTSGRSRRGFESDFETESNSDVWDTESIVSNTSSTVTTINMDDPFPSFGQNGLRSQNSSTSEFATNNSSSVRSYAGATEKSALPFAFERNMESMSISSRSVPKGRGFRRKVEGSDSDASSTIGASIKSDKADFPPLGTGRGRGFIAKHLRKPGGQPEK